VAIIEDSVADGIATASPFKKLGLYGDLSFAAESDKFKFNPFNTRGGLATGASLVFKLEFDPELIDDLFIVVDNGFTMPKAEG
jgi:hypothetical protein